MSATHLRRSAFGGCLVLSLVLAGHVAAQTTAAADSAVDPQADALLRRMSACLAGAERFTFRAHDMMDQLQPDGQRVQTAVNHRFAVRRPNAILADAEGDAENSRYVYDGKTLAIVDRTENLYATLPVPDTIDAMLDFVAQKYTLVMPLSDLFFSDPYAATRPRMRAAGYVGLHQVCGVKCHHLAVRGEAVDWQIWIQAADPPVPRKLVITYKELPGDPQYIAFLDDWNLSASIPDDAFKFTPPPGAQQTDLTPGRRAPAAAEPPDEAKR